MAEPTPIHEIFRSAIDRADLSNAEVARRLQPYGMKVSASTVTKWLSGERGISMETAMRLCDVLGVEWSSLYQSPETTPTPEELITDTTHMVHKRYMNLVLNGTHEVAHKVEEVARLFATSSTENDPAAAFIELAPEVAEQLRAADLLTRNAARGYSSAARSMIDLIRTHHPSFKLENSFEINQIEGQDERADDFTDSEVTNDGSA